MLTKRKESEPLPFNQEGESVAENSRMGKPFASTVMLSDAEGCTPDQLTNTPSPLRWRRVQLTVSKGKEAALMRVVERKRKAAKSKDGEVVPRDMLN